MKRLFFKRITKRKKKPKRLPLSLGYINAGRVFLYPGGRSRAACRRFAFPPVPSGETEETPLIYIMFARTYPAQFYICPCRQIQNTHHHKSLAGCGLPLPLPRLRLVWFVYIRHNFIFVQVCKFITFIAVNLFPNPQKEVPGIVWRIKRRHTRIKKPTKINIFF